MLLSPALMSALGFAEPHIRGRGSVRASQGDVTAE